MKPYYEADAVRYIEHLSRKHFEEIGFLPRTRLAEYVRRGQVAIATENGEPCGFLVWGNGFPVLRVYQACIQYDAQRRKHGYALVEGLIRKGSVEGYESISLWCADDLESNEFWRSCGFTFAGQREGGKRRGRKHNLWMLRLPRPSQGLLDLGGAA